MSAKKEKEIRLAYSYLEGERVEITYLGVKIIATFIGQEAGYLRIYDGGYMLSKNRAPEMLKISGISKIIKAN